MEENKEITNHKTLDIQFRDDTSYSDYNYIKLIDNRINAII